MSETAKAPTCAHGAYLWARCQKCEEAGYVVHDTPPAAPSVAPSVASAPADVAEVRRYILCERDRNGDFDAHMELSPDGAWVALRDHDRVLKAAGEREAAVRAELEAARNELCRTQQELRKAEAERDALRDTLALVVAQSGHDGTITPALYERCASLAADVGKEGG